MPVFSVCLSREVLTAVIRYIFFGNQVNQLSHVENCMSGEVQEEQ